MLKFDPSRLAHLDQIKSRLIGAAGRLNDDHNVLIRQRTETKATIVRLEENMRLSREPDAIKPRLVEAKAYLAHVEARLIAIKATIEQVQESASAAGGLHRSCEEFIERKGRIVA